jgi:hypothetical protein
MLNHLYVADAIVGFVNMSQVVFLTAYSIES